MARLIPHKPVGVAEIQYQYATRVDRTKNGREDRETISGDRPGISYVYTYRLEDDDVAEQELAILKEFNEDMLIPIIHEEEYVTNDITANVIHGSYYVSVGDMVMIVNEAEDRYEVKTITAKDANSLTLDENVTEVFEAGSHIIPLDLVEKIDTPTVSRFPINVSDFRQAVASKRFKKLEGNNTFMTIDGLPLLDINPLNEALIVDTYDNFNEVVQFVGGGRRDTFSQSIYPQKARSITIPIEDIHDWQKIKYLIDYCRGYVKPILHSNIQKRFEICK